MCSSQLILEIELMLCQWENYEGPIFTSVQRTTNLHVVPSTKGKTVPIQRTEQGLFLPVETKNIDYYNSHGKGIEMTVFPLYVAHDAQCFVAHRRSF